MTDKPKDEGAALTDMAGMIGGAMEAAAAGQALTLSLLQAELEAVARFIPALAAQSDAPAASETEAEAEARRRAEEARIETDFDNMPV